MDGRPGPGGRWQPFRGQYWKQGEMEGGAPGLSVSEPGNMAPPLPRGERVAAIARVGGKGWKLGGAMDFCPLCSFLSKKKEKKNVPCRVCMGEERVGAQIFCKAGTPGDTGRTHTWSQGRGGAASLRMFKETCHEH